MLQLVLAASVFAVALAVYGAIGLRWRRRARLRRELLARVAALELDPYHVAALKSEESGAAAAELLLGGYLDIDGEGAVLLTEAGRDPGRTPAHPVPAALLEAVRRHDPEPVSVGWIDRVDEEYGILCSTYRRERAALLPELPSPVPTPGGRLRDCCGCVGVVMLVFLWIAAAELLVVARPHGPLEWAASVVTALGLALLWYADDAGKAVLARTECGDPLGDRFRDERHPAVEALDETRRLHVLTSVGDRGTWRGVDAFMAEDDEDYDPDDLFDEEWWTDAYHYRAADEDEPDGGSDGDGDTGDGPGRPPSTG
ncbi:hypothetical protein ACWGDE_21845 [Streptomyces sp. NPDC054956]